MFVQPPLTALEAERYTTSLTGPKQTLRGKPTEIRSIEDTRLKQCMPVAQSGHPIHGRPPLFRKVGLLRDALQSQDDDAQNAIIEFRSMAYTVIIDIPVARALFEPHMACYRAVAGLQRQLGWQSMNKVDKAGLTSYMDSILHLEVELETNYPQFDQYQLAVDHIHDVPLLNRVLAALTVSGFHLHLRPC